ncbi:hypothetical protein FQN49_006393 [Arthroderma sp. PD_2]|nr:hypothetical protein FQN49_006393 [Arthroderma sp. PD_2]
MFRLLPWSSIARGKEVTAREETVKGMAVLEQNQPPAPKPHSPQKLKRKRSDSAGSEVTKDDDKTVSAPAAGFNSQHNTPHNTSSRNGNGNTGEKLDSNVIPNHQCPDRDSGNATNRPDRSKSEDSRLPVATHNMDTNELRQTLESQLSLEVLLKHDELRMIEQEMAKCQVALEQLRRCAEIPYPGSSLTGPLPAVSNGTGPAVIPRSNPRPAASPSPWGANDGAYTRHYARWLLPDPRFDGGEVEVATPSGAGNGPVDGRTTRASWADTITTSSRSQRGGSGAKLQALSSGYPPPRDKVGPMIIKRKSDGLFVKLVCLDCRRDNFSSTQGFINHCRIAHNRSFASHDAAASASGEPVEFDESGAVVGGQSEPPAAGPAGYVHPLIRSALVADSSKGVQQGQPKKAHHVRQSTASPQKLPKPNPRKRDFQKLDFSPNATFKASPQTPHLSSLMHWKGIDIDLSHIVNDALTKPDVDMLSSDDNSDSDVDDASRTQANLASSQLSIRNNRLPTRTVYPSQPQRPVSRKGMDKRKSDRDVDMADSNSPNLSPNTVESNQAPSLVSDDGEYEARSESESPSPSPSGSEDEGDEFDNIEVQDGDDASADSNASDSASHLSGPAKHHTRPPIPTTPTRNTATRKDSLSKPKHAVHISSRSAQKHAATARSSQKGDGKKRHR